MWKYLKQSHIVEEELFRLGINHVLAQVFCIQTISIVLVSPRSVFHRVVVVHRVGKENLGKPKVV